MIYENEIIEKRCLPILVREEFKNVKSRLIEHINKHGFNHFVANTYEEFIDPYKVYYFDDGNNTINYKTEYIRPPKRTNSVPVMLLFSNPHPGSVANGLFFSESWRSGYIWHRFFVRSDHLCIPKNRIDFNKPWNMIPRDELTKIMAKGEYINPNDKTRNLLLYFHCYCALPTANYEPDVNQIFRGSPDAYNILCNESYKEFHKIIKDFDIKNVIVFATPPFIEITDADKQRYGYKKWRKLMMDGLDNNNEMSLFEDSISIGKNRDGNNWYKMPWNPNWRHSNLNIRIYRNLITRDKNLNNKNKNNVNLDDEKDDIEFYFTTLLNAIFRDILKKT